MNNMNQFNAKNALDDELDAFLMELGKRVMEEESVPQVLNLTRYEHVRFVYHVAKMFAEGNGVEVTYSLHDPFNSMGCVTIEGEDIEFNKMKWFCRMGEFADNVDIYPLTNGKIRMTLTFHGLTKPI